MKDRTILILTGVGIAAAATIYWFGSRIVGAIKDFNKGTPYEGTGVVGALGNATNVVLGGAPQSLGESLSRWIAPMNYDPGMSYNTLFPDNQRHMVASDTIDRNGFFTWPTTPTIPYIQRRYVMGVNSSGQHIARAA